MSEPGKRMDLVNKNYTVWCLCVSATTLNLDKSIWIQDDFFKQLQFNTFKVETI